MKIFETKKTQLKKMTRDKIALESECRKVRETIASMVKSFPQAIKTALINSNKKGISNSSRREICPSNHSY